MTVAQASNSQIQILLNTGQSNSLALEEMPLPSSLNRIFRDVSHEKYDSMRRIAFEKR